ncbi:MAG: sensor histidine kinase [Lachnospiraceae bacterium]
MLKKTLSLRNLLLAVFCACWLIPISLFTFFIFYSYQKAYINKIEKVISNMVNVSATMVSGKIDDMIHLLQQPTYEGTWETLNDSYEKEEITYLKYMTQLRANLKNKYNNEERISAYSFYLLEDDIPSIYYSRQGYSYSYYLSDINDKIEEIRKKESNYTEIFVHDNTLYLARNLYTVNNYRKYGTFVIALNTNVLFKDIPIEDVENVKLYINEEEELKNNDYYGIYYKENVENDEIVEERIVNTYTITQKKDKYDFKLSYIVEHDILYSSLQQLNSITWWILLAMIPIIVLAYIFLNTHIKEPLKKLLKISEDIKDGKFGVVDEYENMPNREFQKLFDSFNAMSIQLQYLFDSVYAEQLARKDAQISALQAQINPHFLNNTLEMMNWQARIDQNIEMSKMIEALGTVLDSSMNRKNDREVALVDEIKCADSFLYIMSMRFGQRLKIIKNIQSVLLQEKVPHLIIQPLLENAIEHGIDKVKSGIIHLNIYREDDEMIIDIINSGIPMTVSEKERIDQILTASLDVRVKESSNHISIGIYNVNRRIQLIYGNSYGLTLTSLQDGRTRARIRIPYNG